MAFSFQFFTEGVKHITDIEGYDHMLFLAALCASYSWESWKKVLWLVTAFTIGHCTTLILAGLDLIRFSSDWIEFLIPCTIAFTALLNLVRWKNNEQNRSIYLIAILFGFIHGMGFSSYFRMISNDTGDMVWSLLAFNLGVEFGQVLIVAVILSLFWMLNRTTGMSKTAWKTALSALVLLVSIYLIKETFPS